MESPAPGGSSGAGAHSDFSTRAPAVPRRPCTALRHFSLLYRIRPCVFALCVISSLIDLASRCGQVSFEFIQCIFSIRVSFDFFFILHIYFCIGLIRKKVPSNGKYVEVDSVSSKKLYYCKLFGCKMYV